MGQQPAGLIGTEQPLSELYDVLLLDLDGVVYIGADAVPGAADALKRARDAGLGARFVTNNASRPAPVVAEHLRELGVQCDDDEVVTSAQAAAGLLAQRFDPGAPILVVGGAGLYWALEQDGLAGVGSMDDEPVAVVQGFGPDVGWRSTMRRQATTSPAGSSPSPRSAPAVSRTSNRWSPPCERATNRSRSIGCTRST